MLVVAGALLGVVVLVGLVGFHTGPHTHAAGVVLGIVTAVLLAVAASDTSTRAPLLYSLLAVDVAISAGMAAAGWHGIVSVKALAGAPSARRLEGSMGTVVGGLSPAGIVRVRGESWSATSLNGPLADGASVQVISVDGVRLSVWGEDAPWPALDVTLPDLVGGQREIDASVAGAVPEGLARDVGTGTPASTSSTEGSDL